MPSLAKRPMSSLPAFLQEGGAPVDDCGDGYQAVVTPFGTACIPASSVPGGIPGGGGTDQPTGGNPCTLPGFVFNPATGTCDPQIAVPGGVPGGIPGPGGQPQPCGEGYVPVYGYCFPVSGGPPLPGIDGKVPPTQTQTGGCPAGTVSVLGYCLPISGTVPGGGPTTPPGGIPAVPGASNWANDLAFCQGLDPDAYPMVVDGQGIYVDGNPVCNRCRPDEVGTPDGYCICQPGTHRADPNDFWSACVIDSSPTQPPGGNQPPSGNQPNIPVGYRKTTFDEANCLNPNVWIEGAGCFAPDPDALPPVPPVPGEEKKEGWSTGAIVGGLALVAAAVGGIVYAIGRSGSAARDEDFDNAPTQRWDGDRPTLRSATLAAVNGEGCSPADGQRLPFL